MSSGSEKRVRNLHLPPVRVSAEELERIAAAAAEVRLALSSYIRETLLGSPAPRAVRKKPPDHRVLSRLLGELGHVGSNLNQLAHAANAGIDVHVTALGSALDDLKSVRDALMRALGEEP